MIPESPRGNQRKIEFLFIINNVELDRRKRRNGMYIYRKEEGEEKNFQHVVTIFVNDYSSIRGDLG